MKPITDIKDWLNTKNRNEGFNKYNLYFLREFKQIDAELAVNNQLLYFLVVEAGVFDNSKMMYSGRKQRTLVQICINDLKKYELRDADIPAFKKALKSFRKRILWMTRIAMENIRLTKYYPYIEFVGYERLIDYALSKINSPDMELAEAFLAEIEKYNSTHKEQIEEHLAGVSKEIEIRDAARKKRADATKAEKDMAKKAKQIERAEIKEMKQYKKEYKKREKKLGIYFKGYYG